MGVCQGSSRGLIWKSQIKSATMTGGRTGGLRKRKKPKKKWWAGRIESMGSTGRPKSTCMKRMRTSHGAPDSAPQALALFKTRSHTGPSTILITTSLETTEKPKRASEASQRERRAAWKKRTVITYFSSNSGKRSLNCSTASNQCSLMQPPSMCVIFLSPTAFCCLWLYKWVINLSHTKGAEQRQHCRSQLSVSCLCPNNA